MISRFPALSPPTTTGRLLSCTNLEHAGDHNQRVTLHAIRVNGSITRAELSEITGLTASALASITRRLQSTGLILNVGLQQGLRGPPASRFAINPESAFSIGLNVDRDHLTMVAVDFEGTVRARAARQVDFASPTAVCSFYRSSLHRLISEGKIPPERLVGVGVARPDDLGTIDLPGRPERYREWDGVEMSELLANSFNLPVFVESDATAAAMGELQFGLGQKVHSFFYLLISSALGGGLILDGNYLRGATGRSAEVGFLPVDDGQGNRLLLQQIVSLPALASRLKKVGVDLSSVRTLEQLPKQAKVIVVDWIEATSEALVEPIIAINCLINPGAILVGGRLGGGLVDRLATRVNELVQARGKELPAIAPMMRAAFSEDAPAVGAAILPFSHFLLPRPGALLKTSGVIPRMEPRATALFDR